MIRDADEGLSIFEDEPQESDDFDPEKTQVIPVSAAATASPARPARPMPAPVAPPVRPTSTTTPVPTGDETTAARPVGQST